MADAEAFATEYQLRFMRLLSHPASRRNHTNVLMHVQGYFRIHLTSQQRQELANLIDRYRQGVATAAGTDDAVALLHDRIP
ncbi:MAG: DUF1722 domain-containing protein [Symbiopectobacterium sp.]